MAAPDPADLFNPYAPPKADLAPGYQHPYTAKQHPPDLAEALRRLNEHVARAENVERDRQVAGARVRVVGWVFSALGAACAVAGVAASTGPGSTVAFMVIGLVCGAMFGLIGLLLVAMDLSLASRTKPSPPEKTLKSYFKAISMARYGYAWSVLSPTAREQTISAPNLGPVQSEQGVFRLGSETDMKAYATTFARATTGFTMSAPMRVMTTKKITLGAVDGDVARLDAELLFQSWPRWVSLVTVLGFVIFRPLLIIGVVCYFVMRKRLKTRVTKTLLRAANGVWYVYDADILEGAAPV
jgi:hypothetical protein